MKKIFLAMLILVSSFSAFADNPNEKILNAFNHTFQNVKDVTWTDLHESYQANFKQNEIMIRVTYDMEGNILKTLRYYYEDQLPIFILAKVKKNYSDKKIYSVVEEASEEGTYYHITLEDAKNWLDIKADMYGSLSVGQKLTKA